jgi:hypothetical protein
MQKLLSNQLKKKALKTLAYLRKVPRVKLVATAGLGLALFSSATQKSKTYEKESS